MPILFMALIALITFGGIGIMLSLAVMAERRHQRFKTVAVGAPIVPEPQPKLKARAAALGH